MHKYLLIFLLMFNLSGCGYNDIQSQDEKVTSSWSEVMNQYQRRADLVPNLVAAIKGYTAHEKDLLEAVTVARSQANQASAAVKNAPDDAQKIHQWQTAQAGLTHAIGQIRIVSERYPELKSHALYQDLMTQLEGTENRIAVARGRYIKAIEQYNTTIRQFPAVLTAKVMDYQPKTNYLPDDAAAVTKAPVVDFSQ
ncbi:LemA family protein [Entomohabitans teleogrylli]|uniref:LemA family protein n=1 Tax=Entomohabitans teleogrylli TaxID=1384589 RepID=UPI00073D6F2A|nr:LemA family protein [Entomohabitans teleogrylli]